MAAFLFARRSTLPVLGAGASLLGKGQQKENREHANRLSKSCCEAPRDWQRVSPIPSFSVSKELLSRPATSRLVTRNDTSFPATLFTTSKTSCEAASLDLEESTITGDVQETTTLSSIPLYGIPDWKKQLSVPELRSHPFLEREEVTIKSSSLFGRLFGGDHVAEITLIGCHHGSKYSAESVKQVLESVDPDIVFVEVCPERAHFMELPADIAIEPFDLIQSIKHAREQGCNGLVEMFGTVLGKYSQHLLWRHGSGLAGEMGAAAAFVKSKPKDSRPLLALGDLPSSFLAERLNQLTTSPISDDEYTGEMWRLEDLYGCKEPRGLSINDEFEDRGYELTEKAWEEEKTWSGYYVRAILDNQDLSAALNLNQRGIHYPKGTEDRATIQERDIYMVSKLLQFCRIHKPKRVVVIIGAAHLPGMRHLLNAGVIGSTRKPEDVIEQLISSTKSLAESEVPLVRDWAYTVSFYHVEMKVPITVSRDGTIYAPTSFTKELEEQK